MKKPWGVIGFILMLGSHLPACGDDDLVCTNKYDCKIHCESKVYPEPGEKDYSGDVPCIECETTMLKDIKDEGEKLELLEDIWNYQVTPLLQEYFYAQTDLLQKVLPSFYNPDDEDQLNDGTLEPLNGEDLIAALNNL